MDIHNFGVRRFVLVLVLESVLLAGDYLSFQKSTFLRIQLD
jgi:hypothetical protein